MSNRFKDFRNSLRRYVPGLFVFGKMMALMNAKRSMLRTTGFIESVKRKRPCRPDGSPVPWMNYNVISLLEERLNKDVSLFEYGSGNSTLFFANLVGKVVSVECEESWYREIADSMPDNVTLLLNSPFDADRYVDTVIEQPQKFDVIVVDAEERPRCMQRAPDGLTDTGVILLDDAAREEYQPATQELLHRGFRKLDFEGLKPGGIRAYRTTVFYRSGNVLGI
ncbi:MAG: FkbM family methyltransferase [Gammaproteobacteria bacterium]|nr:FkbM family methyltransferase [Gammaproteobacteria bacterium]